MPVDPATLREFKIVSARMKLADEALIPLARKNIRIAVAPLPPAIRASAVSTLPKSGGANEWVAGSQISVRTSFIPKTAGVTLRMHAKNDAVSQKRARARAAGKKYQSSPSHDLRSINLGYLRHPVFGNREVWRTTRVRPGFFTDPVRAAGPAVVAAAMAALRETAAIAGYK